MVKLVDTLVLETNPLRVQLPFLISKIKMYLPKLSKYFHWFFPLLSVINFALLIWSQLKFLAQNKLNQEILFNLVESQKLIISQQNALLNAYDLHEMSMNITKDDTILIEAVKDPSTSQYIGYILLGVLAFGVMSCIYIYFKKGDGAGPDDGIGPDGYPIDLPDLVEYPSQPSWPDSFQVEVEKILTKLDLILPGIQEALTENLKELLNNLAVLLEILTGLKSKFDNNIEKIIVEVENPDYDSFSLDEIREPTFTKNLIDKIESELNSSKLDPELDVVIENTTDIWVNLWYVLSLILEAIF